MSVVLIWGAGDLRDWLGWRALTRAWHLAALVAAGAAVYFGVLFLTGVRPRQLLHRPVEGEQQ
jgi:putative peptidoglycan lipid II flippase